MFASAVAIADTACANVQMMSYIRGASADPIAASVAGGNTVSSGNTTVYTHVPPRSLANGAANFTNEASLLATEVDIFTYVNVPAGLANPLREAYYVVNPITRALQELTPAATAAVNAETYMLHYRLSMLSGILAVPNGSGQNTGELLIGYPSTLVGTDVATETGRMKLRMYLGSVLYRRENVMVLPDIAFNGVKDFHVFPLSAADVTGVGRNNDAGGVNYTGNFEGGVAMSQANGAPVRFAYAGADRTTATNETVDAAAMANLRSSVMTAQNIQDLLNETRPLIYQGSLYKASTTASSGFVKVSSNTGHLGCIDSPECIDKIAGVNVYSAYPTPVAVSTAQ
jgi:hypothetical protein